MPVFKLANEDGVWLEDPRLGTPVLVVRSGRGPRSD
jgi:hypothetical protein